MEQRPIDNGDEQDKHRRAQRFQFGPWLFDVDGAQAIIAESPREPRALPVEPWARFYGLDFPDEAISIFWAQHLDRDYAMTTDLDEPLLVATLRSKEGQEYPLLIDGTHRLYRAFAEHRAELPAYVLSADESLVIREDGFIGGSVHWLGHDERRRPGDAAGPGHDDT